MWILPRTLSVYAADTVDSIEELNSPELKLESSLMWRSKPSLLRTWLQRWKRVYWFRLLCGRILKPSQWNHFEEEYTGSLPVIHVNRSASQDNEKEQTTQDTYGLTSKGQYLLFDQSGVSLKTLKATSRLDSPLSSVIWKSWVTALRLDYSQRQKSAHHTEEKECSSWLTPDVSDRRSDKSKQQGLSNQENWATPQTRDYRTGESNRWDNKKKSRNLNDQTAKLNWSTPRAGSTDNSRPNNKGGTAESCQNLPSNGQLGREVHNTNGKSQGSLNPDWVESLMGVPHGWTDLGSWGMESFHSKPQEHIKY